jgi:hypothetical protein
MNKKYHLPKLKNKSQINIENIYLDDDESKLIKDKINLKS